MRSSSRKWRSRWCFWSPPVLMIRTFQSLRDVDPGFTEPDQVQMLRISISQAVVPEFARVSSAAERHRRPACRHSRRGIRRLLDTQSAARSASGPTWPVLARGQARRGAARDRCFGTRRPSLLRDVGHADSWPAATSSGPTTTARVRWPSSRRASRDANGARRRLRSASGMRRARDHPWLEVVGVAGDLRLPRSWTSPRRTPCT